MIILYSFYVPYYGNGVSYFNWVGVGFQKSGYKSSQFPIQLVKSTNPNKPFILQQNSSCFSTLKSIIHLTHNLSLSNFKISYLLQKYNKFYTNHNKKKKTHLCIFQFFYYFIYFYSSFSFS